MTNPTTMTHAVVDLETLGKGHHAAVIEIGVTFCNPVANVIGETRNWLIDMERELVSGGVTDASTIAWWMRQSEKAGARFDFERSSLCNPHNAAQAFGRVIAEQDERCYAATGNSLSLVGNGPTFDLVILSNFLRRHSCYIPWEFWQERDLRTVIEMGRLLGVDPKSTMPFEGIPHSGADDARHEAKILCAVYQAILTHTIREADV